MVPPVLVAFAGTLSGDSHFGHLIVLPAFCALIRIRWPHAQASFRNLDFSGSGASSLTGLNSGGDSTGLGGVFAIFGAGLSVVGLLSDIPEFVDSLPDAAVFGCRGPVA